MSKLNIAPINDFITRNNLITQNLYTSRNLKLLNHKLTIYFNGYYLGYILILLNINFLNLKCPFISPKFLLNNQIISSRLRRTIAIK